ncbi:MAG: YkvA family protein [Polyangiaceae bacterium]
MFWHLLTSVALGLAATWLVLVLVLVVARPKGSFLKEALRVLPDTIRLLRGLAVDASLPWSVRARLWLLFVYLALPFDLIPDFIPVIGYADDVILVVLVLRSVVRRAGADAVRKHWPGTPDGLAVIWRAARLPPDGSHFAARSARTAVESPED